MRKSIFLFLVSGICLLGLAGCVTTQKTTTAPRTAASPAPLSPEPDTSDLMKWLDEKAFPEILHELQTNTFLKDGPGMGTKPFIIVKARGARVDKEIDTLTEAVRELLEDRLLGQGGINLVPRDPVAVFDTPYSLQELHCAEEGHPYEMMLTIHIARSKFHTQDRARVSFRALDVETNRYVEDFSVHIDAVRLNSRENRMLVSPPHPDASLKGLKYYPFGKQEQDLAAAYLARNLSCIYQQMRFDREHTVFVDKEELSGMAGNVVGLMEHQLNLCRQFQVVTKPKHADWIIKTETRKTGSPNEVMIWASSLFKEEDRFVKGLTTFAYFEKDNDCLAGWWKIRKTSGTDPGSSLYGYLQILKQTGGRYTANLYGPGRDILKRGILLKALGTGVAWRWYSEEQKATFSADGVIRDPDACGTISVSVDSYPEGQEMKWELVREG